MTTSTPHPRRCVRIAAFVLAWLAAALFAQAQGTGTIQGRVFNPVSKDYVRNAEVRLDGTNQVTYTEGDGSFQFIGVAAGSASITVNYSGYNTVKETFTVAAGQTAVREINLTSTAASGAAGKDGVVQLQAFTVSSEREGNSKAVAAQRASMSITTSVASDIFGDVADNNVGEFLKYLPGVDLDYVESEARGPRLGGMDSQYVGVSFDGIRSASADANRGGGANSRATSFEGFSITAIESIEINRTTAPDSDADNPAGTINMRTKRAFERRGRTLSFNSSLNFNAEEFTLKKTPGPRDGVSYKWKPNFGFDYGESFFNNRVGVLLSASRAHSYTE
jgi:iron complex outermembrane recepter protein